MKKMLVMGLLLGSFSLSAQISEICTDQIDNDLDYLVDCADPDCMTADCDNAFPCESTSQLYQIRDGNDLWVWDGSTWVDVPGWSNPTNLQINAMGYNVQDGYIYGIKPTSPNRLLRITSTGIVDLGAIPGLPYKSWHTGDFDLNGNLYISNNGVSEMWKIDVSAITATQINLTGIPGGGNLDCSDWTYVAAANKFYGLTQTTSITYLRAFNPDGTHHSDYNLNNSKFCSNGFGALFSDANGNIYAYCNAGQFYQITPDATFSNFTVNQISTNDQSMTNNDGAGCPLGNGIPGTGGDDCCEQVLAILQGMNSSNKTAATIERLEEELHQLKEKQNAQEEIAVLHQNAPNPFHEKTTIRYEIKNKKAQNASIYIFDLNGKIIFSEKIPVQRNGQYTIEGNRLESGMYLYTLIVDDKAVDTKRMILLEE